MGGDMKTIQISKATNAQLNWLAAKAHCVKADGFSPTTDRNHGGEIIESMGISVSYWGDEDGEWWACHGDPRDEETMGFTGETHLIAAIRAYVDCILCGTEEGLVEVPDELA